MVISHWQASLGWLDDRAVTFVAGDMPGFMRRA